MAISESAAWGEYGDKSSSSFAKFYMGILENKAASEKAGRPIFNDVPFVRIQVPGQMDVYDQPAWIDKTHPNAHNNRYPREYAAFQNGQQEVQSGTPLSAWPRVSRSQVEMLAYRGTRTVEQLAGMADVYAQEIMDGPGLNREAKNFLEAARGQAPLVAMRAELEQRDHEIQALKNSIAQIQSQSNASAAPSGESFDAQIAELKRSILKDLQTQNITTTPNIEKVASPPKRRGRPPRTQEVTENVLSNG